jgi:hypothetical protein
MIMEEITVRHFNAYIRLLEVSDSPLEKFCMKMDHIHLFKIVVISEYLETPQ